MFVDTCYELVVDFYKCLNTFRVGVGTTRDLTVYVWNVASQSTSNFVWCVCDNYELCEVCLKVNCTVCTTVERNFDIVYVWAKSYENKFPTDVERAMFYVLLGNGPKKIWTLQGRRDGWHKTVETLRGVFEGDIDNLHNCRTEFGVSPLLRGERIDIL